MMELLGSGDIWLSLLTLTAMEIVLGIDNIVFISILADRLPAHEREKARKLGLMGALVSRLALLSVISWIMKLTTPLFTVFAQEITGKALVLIIGGLFLLYKATKEIHHKIEEAGQEEANLAARAKTTLAATVVQITILDIVFSIDSVITAVGMANHIGVMVAANIVALAVMLLASGAIASFISQHPSIKVLALSFLLMIGLVLVADGAGFHIPKGYVYFAMAFSVFVELINLRSSRKAHPRKA